MSTELDQVAAEPTKTCEPTYNSGSMLETNTKKFGDSLHVLAPRVGGGFDYYRHKRGESGWSGPTLGIGSDGNIRDAVLFGRNDCMNCIYREVAEVREGFDSLHVAGQLWEVWTQDESNPFRDNRGRVALPGASDVGGTPAVCYDSGKRVYDVVAPLTGGSIRHWWRDEHRAHWNHTKTFGQGGPISGCAMLKGEGKGDPQLLVAAVVIGQGLRLLRRDDDNWKWITEWQADKDSKGRPAMVQVHLRGQDYVRYDIVAPQANGGIIHYEFSGFALGSPRKTRRLGGNVQYDALSLVYTHRGELELAARRGSTTDHYVLPPSGSEWKLVYTFAPRQYDVRINGEWSVEYDTKVIGMHAAMLHTGEALLFGMPSDHHEEGYSRSVLLDPRSKGKVSEPKRLERNVFCGGHAFLEDGLLVVAGGHNGACEDLNIYNPDAQVWTRKPKFECGRWYPTCTTLPDDKVLIISGQTGVNQGPINNSYELFDSHRPDDKRTPIDLGKAVGEGFCEDCQTIELYPFVFVLPNKKVLVHSRFTSRLFHYDRKTGGGTWSKRINAIKEVWLSRSYPHEGTSVLLPMSLDKDGKCDPHVLLVGGAGARRPDKDTAAISIVEIMHVNDDDSKAQWIPSGQHLRVGRVMPDAVLLPDGKVLVTSGGRTGKVDCGNLPELSVELFNPNGQTWETLGAMNTPRLYHATAILLPDARVLVTGNSKKWNPYPFDCAQHRGEVFSPPYLRSGKPRPVIVDAPAIIDKPKVSIRVTVSGVAGTDIEKVVLVRPSAATHSFNMEQRVINLFVNSDKGPKHVEAMTPPDNWTAPPGYYMLFVVSKDGVPSEARWVQVKTSLGC